MPPAQALPSPCHPASSVAEGDPCSSLPHWKEQVSVAAYPPPPRWNAAFLTCLSTPGEQHHLGGGCLMGPCGGDRLTRIWGPQSGTLEIQGHRKLLHFLMLESLVCIPGWLFGEHVLGTWHWSLRVRGEATGAIQEMPVSWFAHTQVLPITCHQLVRRIAGERGPVTGV